MRSPDGQDRHYQLDVAAALRIDPDDLDAAWATHTSGPDRHGDDDGRVPSSAVVLDEQVLRFTVPATLDGDTAERLRRQVVVTLTAQVRQLRAELASLHPDLDVRLAG